MRIQPTNMKAICLSVHGLSCTTHTVLKTVIDDGCKAMPKVAGRLTAMAWLGAFTTLSHSPQQCLDKEFKEAVAAKRPGYL